MFKILIVDDEKGHRSGLARLLYTVYPDDMLLEADSGEQALEIMRLLECDIVITDIRMPGMDGIDLLRAIRKEFHETSVIILSGYGEFHYAQDAIQYGISGYLLKPVDIGEVKRCLDNVKDEITARRMQAENQETMKSQLKETEIIYMEYLIQQFVRNDHFEKKEKIKEIFPIEQPGYIFLCDIKIHSDDTLNVQEFRLAMKEYISSASSYSFGTENKNLFAVLVLDKNRRDRLWFDHMQRALMRSLPSCSFAFYVSGCHENMFEESAKAYKEAVIVWEYRFYEPGEYSEYNELEKKMGGEIPDFSDSVGNITEDVKQNDILSAFRVVREKVDSARQIKLPDPNALCRSVMLMLFQVVKNLDPLLSEEMKKRMDESLMRIYRSESVSHLLRQVYGFMLEIGKNIHYQKEIKGVDVLEHSRDYIEKHYMEEITLESVAEKYYFNPSYFSTIFKNYFGKSFSNYLIELRMQKAREYLASSDYKVKEITSLVGYRDANYFVRAFKKFFGYTPEEFRKLRAKD